MDEKKNKQPQTFDISELKHQRHPEYKLVYSNIASTGNTFFDASIAFGQIASGQNGEPAILDHCTVVMAWEHLLALYEAIGTQIRTFEATGQQIRRPEEQKPGLRQ